MDIIDLLLSISDIGLGLEQFMYDKLCAYMYMYIRDTRNGFCFFLQRTKIPLPPPIVRFFCGNEVCVC